MLRLLKAPPLSPVLPPASAQSMPTAWPIAAMTCSWSLATGNASLTARPNLTAKTGRTVEIFPADLTLRSDLLRLEERLRSDHTVTALVNNAGFGATSQLIDSKIEELENMIQLNVTRSYALLLLRSFLASSSVPMASSSTLLPSLLSCRNCSTGPTGGTKAYVVNLTQSLHHEVETKEYRSRPSSLVPPALSSGIAPPCRTSSS